MGHIATLLLLALLVASFGGSNPRTRHVVATSPAQRGAAAYYIVRPPDPALAKTLVWCRRFRMLRRSYMGTSY